jgi:carbonic anhydrase
MRITPLSSTKATVTCPWLGFPDVDDDVRQSIRRIKSSRFVPNTDDVRGFVYEVETGKLREVICASHEQLVPPA